MKRQYTVTAVVEIDFVVFAGNDVEAENLFNEYDIAEAIMKDAHTLNDTAPAELKGVHVHDFYAEISR